MGSVEALEDCKGFEGVCGCDEWFAECDEWFDVECEVVESERKNEWIGRIELHDVSRFNVLIVCRWCVRDSTAIDRCIVEYSVNDSRK